MPELPAVLQCSFMQMTHTMARGEALCLKFTGVIVRAEKRFPNKNKQTNKYFYFYFCVHDLVGQPFLCSSLHLPFCGVHRSGDMVPGGSLSPNYHAPLRSFSRHRKVIIFNENMPAVGWGALSHLVLSCLQR